MNWRDWLAPAMVFDDARGPGRRENSMSICLNQVADDMDSAAHYLNALGDEGSVAFALMLNQSAAAARECATDEGHGQ